MADCSFESESIFFKGFPPKLNGKEHWEIQKGILKIQSSAFNDRENKPSVDSKELSPENQPRNELNYSEGVLRLVYHEILGCTEQVNTDGSGNYSPRYSVSVEHCPEEDNRAHCQIESRPDFNNKRHFRRLRVALATIAKWEIHPESYLESEEI